MPWQLCLGCVGGSSACYEQSGFWTLRSPVLCLPYTTAAALVAGKFLDRQYYRATRRTVDVSGLAGSITGVVLEVAWRFSWLCVHNEPRVFRQQVAVTCSGQRIVTGMCADFATSSKCHWGILDYQPPNTLRTYAVLLRKHIVAVSESMVHSLSLTSMNSWIFQSTM